MADRKGKARAWSAKRAEAAFVASVRAAWTSREWGGQLMYPTSSFHKALTRAYLDGWQAALNSDDPIGDRDREQARLGMSPQAKRKGKSGEGRTNAG